MRFLASDAGAECRRRGRAAPARGGTSHIPMPIRVRETILLPPGGFAPPADRSETVRALLALPTVPQKSEAWLALRQELVSASAFGQVLGVSKFGSADDLLLQKAAPELAPPFQGDAPPLLFGVRHEDTVMGCYRARAGLAPGDVHEFGLLVDPSGLPIGASPDGITRDGVMIELKAPWRRALVDGHIPPEYELQCQGQLAVADLDVCDYCEATVHEHEDEDVWEAHARDLGPDDSGAIWGVETRDGSRYERSPPGAAPDEVLAWVRERRRDPAQPAGARAWLWTLDQIQIVRVERDRARWESEIRPKVCAFWDRVLRARARVARGLPPEPGMRLTIPVQRGGAAPPDPPAGG